MVRVDLKKQFRTNGRVAAISYVRFPPSNKVRDAFLW